MSGETQLPNHEWYNNIEHYQILGLPNTAPNRDIKRKYNGLSLKFHEDSFRREGKDYTPKDKQRWEDILLSYKVLSDERLRRNYDQDVTNDVEFQCTGCLDDARRSLGYISGRSFRVFCNLICSTMWEGRDEFDEVFRLFPHDYPERTADIDEFPDEEKLPKKVCPGCGHERPFKPELWKKFAETDPDEDCRCSDYCLEKLLKSRGVDFAQCAHCNKIKTFRQQEIWEAIRGKDGIVRIYCKHEHFFRRENKAGGLGFNNTTDPLQTEKDAAEAEIENALNGNPPVTSAELKSANQDWRNSIINATDDGVIGAIKNNVLTDIQQKRTDKENKQNALDNYKQAAIAEIKVKLSEEPEVKDSELESGNKGWENDIQNAANEGAVDQIKDKVLTDITNKRQAKNSLNVLREAAIDEILNELAKEPSLDESEITNRNWEEEITKASFEDAINDIRNKVLADIHNKREAKKEKGRLDDLLTQAKESKNWNDYQNLENIFQQIKELRSTTTYQDKVAEIQVIENRLRELEPDKFKQGVRELLNRQVKNNKLNDNDLDTETQEAMTEAEQNPLPQKIKVAEDKIAVCGARKELKEIFDEAAKAQTNQEKNITMCEIDVRV